ncbi:MAG: L-seryl-tRNA(Sec) selenium transferase [Planctomycetota bacterium]
MRESTESSSPLRALPAVDAVLRAERFRRLLVLVGHDSLAGMVRHALELRRQELLMGEPLASKPAAEIERLARIVERRLEERDRMRVRRVINATGIILHTGLGRAVYAESVVDAVGRELSGYTTLEIDPETGTRGRREQWVTERLVERTGAEAALVVNNNAAATLLMLRALAFGREVLVARGELVEIGGSYRMPDVMEASGARLVEVGATNRVYVRDYERRLGPETGLIVQVHTSNFRVVGFHHHPPLSELVALGRKHQVPVVWDLGSGLLLPAETVGIEGEPTVAEGLAAGADLICFSGDKLLGGPQSGILLGRSDLIEELRQDPLYRAVRLDKFSLLALGETLDLYKSEEQALREIPTLAMLSADVAQVEQRARRLEDLIRQKHAEAPVAVVRSEAQAGSGSVPGRHLPSWALSVSPGERSAAALARGLRLQALPVFGRVHQDRLLLDLRTVRDEDLKELAAAVVAVLEDNE